MCEADADFVSRLQHGDEGAFTELVERYGTTMLRVARRYVKTLASAEEVVQESWLAALQGLRRFEGRSSLRSWLFAIVVKKAITRGTRDDRIVPFSSYAAAEISHDEPAVAPERFAGPGSQWPRHWLFSLNVWPERPDDHVLEQEARAVVDTALATLPQAQRAVVSLRDLAGHDTAEVANALELSESNVRVLLHRGRSKIRQALEAYYAVDSGASNAANDTRVNPVQQPGGEGTALPWRMISTVRTSLSLLPDIWKKRFLKPRGGGSACISPNAMTAPNICARWA